MKALDRIGKAISGALSGKKPEEEPLLFNQAVNFDKRAIFIAVPKTGTTSIRRQLTLRGPKFIKNPHLTAMQVRDGLYSYFLHQYLDRNRSFPTETDKVLSDAEIRRLAADTFDGFFKFASVRNPWARTLSLFQRGEGVQVSGDMDFDRFCTQLRHASDTCSRPSRVDNQLDWMTDEDGTLLVDYVLRLEEHDAGIRQINEMTDGRLGLRPQHLNRNPKATTETYRDAYSPQARRHVAELFARDIEYFGYEF